MPQTQALRPGNVEEALANPAMRRILQECIRKAKSPKDLSRDADVPMASTYRLIHQLVELGALQVERSAMTKDGKPYDLYRSRIRSGTIDWRHGRTTVTWEANAGVDERLSHLWSQLEQ